MTPRRLAVIPARSGSKRLPGKNLREFCGKPMIAHILETARASALFDAIHVSTDSKEIAQVAAGLGFAPEFARPAELAGDDTPLLPVLRQVAEEYRRRGRDFDQLSLLYACAPLVEAADLQAAMQLYDRLGAAKVVLGAASFPVPVEWAYRLESDTRLAPLQAGMFQTRSQDLEPAYYDAGAFALFPMARILSDAPHDERDFHGYVLPRHKAVDIDDAEDWRLAELLYRGARAR